jgi:hypothetical protein
MSKGLGRLQRRILAVMRDGKYYTVPELVAAIHDRNLALSIANGATQSELSSTRRALSGLSKLGLVFRASRRWTRDKCRVLADTLRQKHYLRSVPTRPLHYFEHDGAVVCFAVPANKNFSQWLLGKPNAVAELSRAWAPDGHRPNLMTETLSRAIKSLRQAMPGYEAVVSFADANVGHRGGLYRAAGWVDLGAGKETRYYRKINGIPVARRNVTDAAEESALPKLRFVRGLTRVGSFLRGHRMGGLSRPSASLSTGRVALTQDNVGWMLPIKSACGDS